jgi:hypothetical protein
MIFSLLLCYQQGCECMLYGLPDLQLSKARHDDHGVEGCIWFAYLFLAAKLCQMFLNCS